MNRFLQLLLLCFLMFMLAITGCDSGMHTYNSSHNIDAIKNVNILDSATDVDAAIGEPLFVMTHEELVHYYESRREARSVLWDEVWFYASGDTEFYRLCFIDGKVQEIAGPIKGHIYELFPEEERR